jgi:hypothetical protein
MHLNHVPDGEPASLCLYFEPWAAVRRTWTAERFLQRILFWLSETSKNSLHRPDQPLEPMYFESPIDVVLPPDWEASLEKERDNILVLAPVQRNDSRCTLRTLIIPRAAAAKNGIPQTVALHIRVPEVVHAGVEKFPATLGQLSDTLERRGSNLLEPLKAEVLRIAQGGVGTVRDQRCLLLLSVPTKRTADGDVERVDFRGFQLPCEFWKLGSSLSLLSDVPTNGKYHPITILGGANNRSWRDITTTPVALKHLTTPESARRLSAISNAGADDRRVLAGVGALGSALVDLWTREGWGRWIVVDPDFVQPHNVVRHLARDVHIGHAKVDVVKDIIDSTFPLSGQQTLSFQGDITIADQKFNEARKDAVLLVDATTTLEAPRELARRDDVPRSASVFLTPSGNASVLLLEDGGRRVRLDELEAQYYGAILTDDWGDHHLVGHNGELWFGAGCRDISLALSNELVQLHASILARQVRANSADRLARIRTWTVDEASAVRAVDVAVQPVIRETRGVWAVVSHHGISEKLKRLRAATLPNETGGIIVGYFDHPLKRVYVVDVLPAPEDSEGSETGFVRGVVGLEQSLATIRARTANIVDYIGEWHSHPPKHRSSPSRDDIGLLAHCARTLALDGVPALMVIVGESGEISYSIGGRFEAMLGESG